MTLHLSNKEFVLIVISIVSVLIIICTLLWVYIKYPFEKIPGQRFVSDEIPILGIGLKPITIITFSAFIGFISALEILHSYLLNLPDTIKTLIFIFFCFLAFGCSHELIWQYFSTSDAFILSGGNIHIDMLHILPNQQTPTGLNYNFTFRTKLVFFYTACSFYGIYFFNKMMRIDNIDYKISKNNFYKMKTTRKNIKTSEN